MTAFQATAASAPGRLGRVDWAWLPRGLLLGLLAFAIFGPLANLVLWAVAERWYFPHMFPISYGFSYWARVFAPRGGAIGSLLTSGVVACLTVGLSLALAIPAGYALARLKLPFRGLILLALLVPNAFPNLPIYVNIARIFYQLGLNGTVLGVVLVHTTHGLVYAVWIGTASFSAVDRELEEAARSLGASAWRAFLDVDLPLAAPGLMASAIFVFLEFARRVHRDVLRRRAGREHAAPSALYGGRRRELPDRIDHRADPPRSLDRIHVRRRTLPEGGRSCPDRPMTGIHSTWLMPSRDDARLFADIVEALSLRFDTPRFEPHLTLLQDREVPAGRLGQFWRGRRLDSHVLARITGVEAGPRYFRSIYARIADEPGLHGLHAAACLEFGAEEAFMPHVSLAYGVPESPSKREARRLLCESLQDRPVRFDRICITSSGKDMAVAEWRVRDEILLA